MFQILFDPGEYTCFADSPKGTTILPVSAFDRRKHSFFAINPIDARRDHAPSADYHRVDRPRRADANVIVYRNILLEMDRLSLAEQWTLVQDLALPFATCVYSGGKSYHFIVSLKEPAQDRRDYDDLARRIYQVFEGKVDRACRNPSRLSRAPFHLRRETFKFQDLKEQRGRVSREELEQWLSANGIEAPVTIKDEPVRLQHQEEFSPGGEVLLFRSSDHFLSHGAPAGSWNHSLFKAACDALSKGWDISTFTARAKAITGTLDERDLATIQSAMRTVQRSS